MYLAFATKPAQLPKLQFSIQGSTQKGSARLNLRGHKATNVMHLESIFFLMSDVKPLAMIKLTRGPLINFGRCSTYLSPAERPLDLPQDQAP